MYANLMASMLAFAATCAGAGGSAAVERAPRESAACDNKTAFYMDDLKIWNRADGGL